MTAPYADWSYAQLSKWAAALPADRTIRVVNVKDWDYTEPRPYVYVGRKMFRWLPWTPWGNPFRIRQSATEAEREECLIKFDAWFDGLSNRDDLLDKLAWEVVRSGLKPLGCWCSPKACHADSLARRIQPRVDRLVAEMLAELERAKGLIAELLAMGGPVLL
jgi:hypothetical protein